MENPFFSIIIPTFNRAKMIQKAIRSVFDQSFDSWEIIVVDDGSTDNTEEVILSYNNPKVRYIYQENKERSAARNLGISQSKGRFICFLDNDDLYLSEHLQKFYNEIMKQNFTDGMYLSGHIIKSNGVELSRSKFFTDSYKNAVTFAFQTLPFPDDVCLPRHIAIGNPFPEEYNIFEDGHVWMRILSRYPLFQITDHTCIVTEHSERSTNKIFEGVDVNYLKTYINCANDLFDNYGLLLEPYFPRANWKKFIISKLITVSQIAISKGKYTESRQILSFMINQQPSTLFNYKTLKLGLMSAKKQNHSNSVI